MHTVCGYFINPPERLQNTFQEQFFWFYAVIGKKYEDLLLM